LRLRLRIRLRPCEIAQILRSGPISQGRLRLRLRFRFT
jgi:hypothetical protein